MNAADDASSLPALRPSNQGLQRDRQDLASAIQPVEMQRSLHTPAITCGWCNKPGHTVKNCAGPPGEDGCIAACPIHNARHSLSDCPEAKQWDDAEKHWWLVASRANLPPLRYHEDWDDVAYVWISRIGQRCSDALPFTAEYCQKIPDHKYAEYDYDCPSRKPLGYEEETSSIRAFWKWYNGNYGGELKPALEDCEWNPDDYE
ncbi:hypothetical protein PG988_000227 [Apiospora saccharicola]